MKEKLLIAILPFVAVPIGFMIRFLQWVVVICFLPLFLLGRKQKDNTKG
jgi:hypothetical protein